MRVVNALGVVAVLFAFLTGPVGAVDISDEYDLQLAINKGPSNEMVVALTFDDGPRQSTPQLLALLDELGIHATFFVCGNYISNCPEQLQAIHNAGHEIGNHTWSHPNLARMSADDVAEQLESTSDLIESLIGERPVLFRPPYGAHNQTVRDTAADMGMATIMWTVDPRDWRDYSSGTIAGSVVGSASSGSIILLHEGHPNTLLAVRTIVSELQAEGYRFVTVGELLGISTGIARKETNPIEMPLKPEERGIF
jgi:peptidoglycan/xylan/chitin deacetylase (PgdA/CDA1 family)